MALTSTYQFSCVCEPTVHEAPEIPARCPKCGAEWVNQWGMGPIIVQPNVK